MDFQVLEHREVPVRVRVNEEEVRAPEYQDVAAGQPLQLGDALGSLLVRVDFDELESRQLLVEGNRPQHRLLFVLASDKHAVAFEG